MTDDTTLMFMSAEHVAEMNRRLATDELSKAECAKLDRRYVLAYELTSAEGPHHWQMVFDPSDGVFFTLDAPVGQPDVYLKGPYVDYLRFLQSQRAGAQPTEDPTVAEGSLEELQAKIGPAFAAAGAVATIKTEMPV